VTLILLALLLPFVLALLAAYAVVRLASASCAPFSASSRDQDRRARDRLAELEGRRLARVKRARSRATR
jgi:hypothetical protein